MLLRLLTNSCYTGFLLLQALLFAVPAEIGAQRTAASGSTSSASAKAPRDSDVIDVGRFDEERLAELIFAATNQERARYRLPTLAPAAPLRAAAREHSQDMSNRSYFSHKSKGLLRRDGPAQRIQQAGGAGYGYAENIGMLPIYTGRVFQRGRGGRTTSFTGGRSYEQMAAEAMRMWMNSPGHRENILRPNVTTLGVGAAIGEKDGIPYLYLTQNFGL